MGSASHLDLDPAADPRIITIPSVDAAFARIANRVLRVITPKTPVALETRLRRLFPRAVVRRRDLSGETPAWYVYRDGQWRPSLTGSWWDQPGMPQMVISRDGWVIDADLTALDLLELQSSDLGVRHFTDFVAPGTLEDVQALLRIIDRGDPLNATIVLRPTSGHLIAVDTYARREGETVVAALRLADDAELPTDQRHGTLPQVVCNPETDVAFSGYVALALSRMPEPTADGLAMRLRRLYPHAEVAVETDRWVATREQPSDEAKPVAWWSDPSLPLVRYDAQALILEANGAAEAFLGHSLVGHYWQEFVTPGSVEQVSAMLAILAEVGRAESRFRMPGPDGSLVEFDSYTEVDGETFTTAMRRRDNRPDRPPAEGRGG